MSVTRMMLLFAACLVILAFGLLPGQQASAHHYDDGHSGYLYNPVQGYEMNGTTVNGVSTQIDLKTFDSDWAGALVTSISNWNAGMNFYGWVQRLRLGLREHSRLRRHDTGVRAAGAHGCVQPWSPDVPSAEIHMEKGYFSFQDHRVSDLMHEMGHVLFHAGEHYPSYAAPALWGIRHSKDLDLPAIAAPACLRTCLRQCRITIEPIIWQRTACTNDKTRPM